MRRFDICRAIGKRPDLALLYPSSTPFLLQLAGMTWAHIEQDTKRLWIRLRHSEGGWVNPLIFANSNFVSSAIERIRRNSFVQYPTWDFRVLALDARDSVAWLFRFDIVTIHSQHKASLLATSIDSASLPWIVYITHRKRHEHTIIWTLSKGVFSYWQDRSWEIAGRECSSFVTRSFCIC